MSTATAETVLGTTGAPGLKERIMGWVTGTGFDAIARAVRPHFPIIKLFGYVAVLRFDDVVEVFGNAAAFPVDYRDKLAVIMGPDHVFFLGEGDTPGYRRDTGVLRRAMRPDDIAALAAKTEALAKQLVSAGNGRIEVVQMARDVTFGVLSAYFGVTAPPGTDLQVIATRLFQFQFADLGNDPALRAKVEQVAPVLRAHIDGLIAAQKMAPPADTVLSRLLALQAQGLPGTDDAAICTALMGVVVGGPPQPPMVVPQALEQLLQRPGPLAEAQQAAAQDDDPALAALVTEAMRFDPLAPGLFRRAAIATTVAEGTSRATAVKAGAKVFVAFRSAMRDATYVPNPEVFDATRPSDQYIHFGHGLHTCFGIHLNRALLPLMLKPLLAQPNLRRAPGAAGHLTKRGGFADHLAVTYG